jgi:hypothetical protein
MTHAHYLVNACTARISWNEKHGKQMAPIAVGLLKDALNEGSLWMSIAARGVGLTSLHILFLDRVGPGVLYALYALYSQHTDRGS